MTIRFAFGMTAAALFVLTLAAAQSSAQDGIETEDTAVSLVGCVMRETDYRRQNDSGKGGFLGFGGGLGDEYVLVRNCEAATPEGAYELTGPEEDDLEPFVGRRVALTGILKEAEIDPATGRPTGGRQAGDDLRLFEVNVESFRALGPVRTDTLARVDVVQERPVDRDRQARGTAGVQADAAVTADDDRLPRTASPLALTGFLGLLSVGGVAGLRALYRRDRRQFR